MVRGIIFDLDGTLVDSRLDFAAMRRDLGLPERTPILEALAAVGDDGERTRLEGIVLRHELAGAERATLMPGVEHLWSELARRDLRTAVFTRNARAVTEHTLARVGLAVDLIIAREDAPPKPRKNWFTRIGSEGERFVKREIKYSAVKRDIAKRLGIDPYSSNPYVQEQLSSLAWVGSAGNFSAGSALGATLIDRAARHGAGYLVAGGFGHARLSETLFGGVTRDLLRGAPCPIFLAHRP